MIPPEPPNAAELERDFGVTLPVLKPGDRPRRVIIESPYAGAVERNTAYARAALRDSLLRGEAPFASHLLYTQEGVLVDLDSQERSLGMRAGFAWIEVAEATVVYRDFGISPGMRSGIARARTAGRPVEFRSIPDWDEPLPVRGAPSPAGSHHAPGYDGPGSPQGPRARPAGPARAARGAGMPRLRGPR